MAELHSCYPSSLSDKRKKESRRLKKNSQNRIQRKRGEIKESQLALIPLPVARLLLSCRPLPAGSYLSVYCRWVLSDISCHQEVHHHFVALLHAEQLRDLHVSALACSPPSCISHLFPEHFLLVFPWAAVAAEMFWLLGPVNRSGQIGQIQGSTGPICAKGGFFSGHLARLSID